jgi:hypothetical protein
MMESYPSIASLNLPAGLEVLVRRLVVIDDLPIPSPRQLAYQTIYLEEFSVWLDEAGQGLISTALMEFSDACWKVYVRNRSEEREELEV